MPIIGPNTRAGYLVTAVKNILLMELCLWVPAKLHGPSRIAGALLGEKTDISD